MLTCNSQRSQTVKADLCTHICTVKQSSGRVVSALSAAHVSSYLCCVCLAGLDPERHLGKSLAEMEPYLHEVREKINLLQLFLLQLSDQVFHKVRLF